MFIKQCKEEDPVVRRQQAVPSSMVEDMAQACYGSNSPRRRMVGALAVLAFFFLLRVGEYTPSNTPRRTVPCGARM